MEARRTILAVVLAVLLMLLWPSLINTIGRMLGYDMSQVSQRTQPADPTTLPTDAGPILATTGPTTGTTAPATTGPAAAPAPAAATAGVRVVGADAASLVSLGSDAPSDPTWAMQLNLNALGGSVGSVVLNDYRAETYSDRRYTFATPYDQVPQTLSLLTRQVTINGRVVDTATTPWRVESQSDTAYTLAVDIVEGETPLATIRKTYTVLPREEGGDDGPRGLQVLVSQSIQNRTQQPLTVQSALNGPTLPPAEIDYGADRQVVAGYFDGARIEAEGTAIESLTESSPSHELLVNSDGVPALWFGTASTYFTAIVRPELPEGGRSTDLFEKVTSTILNPAARRSWERQVQTVIQTKPQVVPAGGSSDLVMRVYFGPRKREILANAYYGAPTVRLDKILVIATGPCSICVFPSLIDGLVFLLRAFYFVVRDWGLAIIILVCLVRLLLHPITRKSQLSMMKMAKLGPEMERLKKKYGDNKEELSRAMMQFYRETGFSPLMGCLPMFLQMPIWIALWQALHTTFELRHAPFLYGFTWIDDLSRPDHLIDFGRENSFTLLFIHVSGLNVLPLLLAVVFYFQMKLQPQPAAMTPEQEQQQKIMKILMPILFPLLLYPQPSGLNLYILVSTVIGIVESASVRKQAKRLEELEAAGAVVKDAPTTDEPRRRGKGGAPAAAAAPKPTGFRGWLANLQQKADDLRREAERQQQQKRKR
jgi:YidC/Oxa1 family membrane protein insertase